MHVYGQRNICIWLTQETSHQVGDIPFKSIPFIALTNSIHVFSKNFRNSIDLQTKTIIVNVGSEFLPFYATRVDRCGLPIALCRTAKLSEKPFYVTFGPGKGKPANVARCITVRMKGLRFSIFWGKMVNGDVLPNGCVLLIKDLLINSNQLINRLDLIFILREITF